MSTVLREKLAEFEQLATHRVANLVWSPRESQQLFASKYQTVLPTEAELVAMLEHEKLGALGYER